MSKENEIISFLRTEVNEQNIKSIVSDILKRLNESGKNASVINVDYGDGSSMTRTFAIGANKFESWNMGGYLSSDKEYISDNIRINVMGGLGNDIVDTTMGDCFEAYEILIRRLQQLDTVSFENVMKEVYATTADFFGSVDKVDINEREKYYAHLGDISMTGKVSDLKGRNLAACVERAALSQNLLKFLGYDSVFKQSQITNGDKNELHAYNLVAYNGKYYIFDATIPRVNENGEVTPIITEIPKEAFDTLSIPRAKDDVSIKTEHKSVKGFRKIHYNSWSKNIIDTTNKSKDEEDIGEL
jgi:hypothetical protein